MNGYKGFSGIFNARLVLTSALLILVSGCGGAGGEGAGSSAPPDTTAPTVTTASPGEDESGTATNSKLTATFSESMIAADINTANFRLADGDIAVPGAVSYDSDNKIATFAPTDALAPNTRYTATIITGIKDLGGNALTTDFAWCFVTGDAADNAAPSITATDPADAAAEIAVNRVVSATFSEEMRSSTLTPANFTVKGPGDSLVSGKVTYIDRTAVFTATQNLASNTAYTATIGSGVLDLAGNAALVDSTWSFTTDASTDVAAPVVISTSPANAESGVAISRTVVVLFNEAMDPRTITTASFTVAGPGATPVIGTVTFDAASNTAIFTRINHLTTPVDFHPVPVSYLDANTTYTATLNTQAKDMAGNKLASSLVWSFTTAP